MGAWAAGAIGRAAPVRAQGENIVVGGVYTTATSITTIRNQTNSNNVFSAQSAGSAIGVYGLSGSGVGVYGDSTSGFGTVGNSSSESAVVGISQATNRPAILGRSPGNSTGVLGYSGLFPPLATGKTGVYGHADQDGTSRGVFGRSTSGQGVRGEATSGSGLLGTASSGYAIRGDGRLRFDKVSGVATITAGSTSKIVNPGVNVTAASFVLLTPKANVGGRAIWFTTNPTTNKFTIRMSSARGSATKIAWLLVG
ncbi:MAG TPA: hypothetical protein VF114_07920 [Candidatus Limnocylindria bacterium]